MVEKYRGITPPGSIWYRLTREESIVLIVKQGLYKNLTPDQRSSLNSSEILAEKGKASEVEKLLTDSGLKIITLFD